MNSCSEIVVSGNLRIEISVKSEPGETCRFWVHCRAKNSEGRVAWQSSITNEEGLLKIFSDPGEALSFGKNVFSSNGDEDFEFQGLAKTQVDSTNYFLSLF
jgi:hypothetical protein